MLGNFAKGAVAAAAFVALSAAPVAAASGKVFYYVDPAGAGESTIIKVTPDYVVMNDGTSDGFVVDRRNRKLYVAGPDGRLMDIASMMPPVQQAPAAPAASSGGPADLETLLASFPAAMRPQIRAQIAALPHDQQLQLLAVIGGQMGISINPSALPSEPSAPTPIQRTGNSGKVGQYQADEVRAGDDLIWVTDPSSVDGGADFMGGMQDLSDIAKEVMSNVPMQGRVMNNSMFRVGELGGFPLYVTTQDGDVFAYSGMRVEDVNVSLPAN